MINFLSQKSSVDIDALLGKAFLDASATNSYAENYFTFLKSNLKDSPIPVYPFVEEHWNNLKGIRCQYVDGPQSSLEAKQEKMKVKNGSRILEKEVHEKVSHFKCL